PNGLSNVVALAAGSIQSLALKSDGSVVSWGSGSSGVTNVPPGLGDVVAIAGGAQHCLALRRDGTVVAWGNNASGQTNVPSWLTVLRSTPRVSSGIISNGEFNLILTGLSGHGQIVIYASTNLVNWEPIFSNPPTTGSLLITDPTATNWPRRFYWMQEQ